MLLPPIPDIQPPTAKFKRGDVVRLNSGGPAMTVSLTEQTTDYVVAQCWWFWPTSDGLTNSGFPEDCLTLVEP